MPEAGDMVNIGRVLSFGDEQGGGEAAVTPGGLWRRDEGALPAWGGVELSLVPSATKLPYDLIAEVTVRDRAIEDKCVAGYANYCGHEGGLQ
ncbi:hypothetical protein B1218_36865 [Pseudomonas ogarae]|nr:hypothetical protein B1218_36865 [Pseudomonas ogarae]